MKKARGRPRKMVRARFQMPMALHQRIQVESRASGVHAWKIISDALDKAEKGDV